MKTNSHNNNTIHNNGNLGTYLREQALRYPDKPAILYPSQISFAELDKKVDQLAHGLSRLGVRKGSRVIMLVKSKPGFYSLSFALLRMGAILVMIDPGVGRKVMKESLAEVDADAFIGIPKAHIFRLLYYKAFKNIKLIITDGPRLLWGGYKLKSLINSNEETFEGVSVLPDETGGIFFTSGSTGAPKGVIYENSMFHAQISYFRTHYKWTPQEIDLCTFPLIGLFSLCLGVSIVIADLDPARPAGLKPEKIWANLVDYQCTHMFCSPMILRKLAAYGEQNAKTLQNMNRIVSAGAPVPPELLKRMKAIMPEKAEIHTPYGATEALPVTDATASELIGMEGSDLFMKGICVGRPLQDMQVKIIEISDEPIREVKEIKSLHFNQVGEIIVSGPVVTKAYLGHTGANQKAKFRDSSGNHWHRMGDVGRIDESGRLWFYGRKNHRVETKEGCLYTIPVEAVFNQHADVERSALVGIRQGNGEFEEALICIQTKKSLNRKSRLKLIRELEEIKKDNQMPGTITRFLLRKDFPVDPRHNAKIFREKLSEWASEKIK